MSRASGPSPGPAWAILSGALYSSAFPRYCHVAHLIHAEPLSTPSVMHSSDEDGDDELEVESELIGMPLTKRKAPSSPSSLGRANKAPRLGLSQPAALATGEGSNRNRIEDRSSGDGPSRTQPCSDVPRIPPLSTVKPVSPEVVGSSSPDEFEESLTQTVRRRLRSQKEVQRVEPPSRVARKQVGNRQRVSTGSLLKGAQKDGKPFPLARQVLMPFIVHVVFNAQHYPLYRGIYCSYAYPIQKKTCVSPSL